MIGGVLSLVGMARCQLGGTGLGVFIDLTNENQAGACQRLATLIDYLDIFLQIIEETGGAENPLVIPFYDYFLANQAFLEGMWTVAMCDNPPEAPEPDSCAWFWTEE